ncbi:MAG: 4'-phosphopantetheinyl transferase superfamily protein [Shewanellaceae bacterium]|nr:4'-phosphopantetheinyl transferase superfamily protein [Shewanellaceae bacterium]
MPSRAVFLSHIQTLYEHPDKLCLRLARYDINQFEPGLLDQLPTSPPHHIQQACRSRQASFLAGRLIATSCLQAINAASLQVQVGRQREPLWPKGYAGSITHKNNIVAAISAPSAMGGVGIDYEHWLPPNKATKLARAILSPDEYEQQRHHVSSKHMTLCFSAKETLFKALYPQVQAHFGFQAARITSVQWQEGTYIIELLEQLTADLSANRAFQGHFSSTKQGLLTWMQVP